VEKAVVEQAKKGGKDLEVEKKEARIRSIMVRWQTD